MQILNAATAAAPNPLGCRSWRKLLMLILPGTRDTWQGKKPEAKLNYHLHLRRKETSAQTNTWHNAPTWNHGQEGQTPKEREAFSSSQETFMGNLDECLRRQACNKGTYCLERVDFGKAFGPSKPFWRFGPWINLSLPLRKQNHMCWSQDCQEKSQCLAEVLQTTSQAWKNTLEKRGQQRFDNKNALKKAHHIAERQQMTLAFLLSPCCQYFYHSSP